MKKFFPLILLLPCLTHTPLSACGGGQYAGMLNDTGAGLLTAPETVLAKEIRRLAPKTEFVRPGVVDTEKYGYRTITGIPEAEAFAAHLDAALTRAGAPAAERQKIVTAYRIRRDAITAKSPATKIPPIPAGLPEAFALFEKAGDAWRASDGAREPGAPEDRYARCKPARDLWRAVLERPENERRELIAPSLFMLARAELENADRSAVPAAIEALRRAVRAGAPDSVGYAAATCQLERHLAKNDWEKLENLLVQAGAGMDDDFVSVHIRRHCGALLAGIKTGDSKEFAREALAHPAARQLITAYMLSRGGPSYDGDVLIRDEASLAWVRLLGELPGELPEAAQITATAYQRGDYEQAERWYARVPKDDPLSALIGSRLMLRKGDPDRAAERLAAAVPAHLCFFAPTSNVAVRYADMLASSTGAELPGDDFAAKAAAELAMLRMAQGRHTEALDLFLRTELLRDAAVVAERFLPTDQLKEFIAKPHPVRLRENREQEVAPPYAEYLRTLLARRLMREGKPDEAAGYFSGEDKTTFDKYRSLLRLGHDTTAPSEARAKAFFEASELVYEHGNHLFKSVTGPRRSGGKFFDPDAPVTSNDGTIRTLRTRIGEGSIRPLPEIRDRIMRFRAGELALYASSLLPENDADSARMLWRAGRWHADAGDARSADVFYKLLCLRHPKTELGKAALKLRWLPKQERHSLTLEKSSF